MIHGGGWVAGDKANYARTVQPYLDAGVSVAAINYRFIAQAMEQGVEPPVKAPLHDAARALQTIRSKAKEWNIDPQRIGLVGFSAGGHLALATATGFSKRLYEPIDTVDVVSCRPDFAILCYPGYLKAKDKDEIRRDVRIPVDLVRVQVFIQPCFQFGDIGVQRRLLFGRGRGKRKHAARVEHPGVQSFGETRQGLPREEQLLRHAYLFFLNRLIDRHALVSLIVNRRG